MPERLAALLKKLERYSGTTIVPTIKRAVIRRVL
jgi:hypothetical protein